MAPHKKRIVIKTSKYELLCDSVQKGLKENVRQLLAEGAPVNPKGNSLNNTPLHLSIINFTDVEIVKMLLEKGADTHAQNLGKQQPFEIAIDKNNVEVISLFLSRKTLTAADLSTLILRAINNQNENIIKLLINYAVAENRSSLLAKSILMSMRSENKTITTILLPHCAPIFTTKLFVKNGEFAYVFYSVKEGNVAFVRELLRYKFNVNVVNKFTGLTLLHVACMYEHEEIIELLLNHGANVNAKVSNEYTWNLRKPDREVDVPLLNRTPIYVAVFLSNVSITKKLLSKGVNLNDELHVLNIACQVMNEEIVHELIKAGADINTADQSGGTPLYYSITPFSHIKKWQDNDSSGDDVKSEIADLLLNHGANPNTGTAEKQFTPLFAAIYHGYLKCVKVLLKYDIDIQHTDIDGNAALHFAALVCNKGMMETLLNHNFEINVQNKGGFTPLHFVAERGSIEVLDFLMKKHNAIFQMSDMFGVTPFHWACVHLNKQNVTYFLENNIDVNIRDKNDKTALHILAENKFKVDANKKSIKELVEILLKYETDIFAEDSSGTTPIFAACANRNLIVLEILLKYVINRYPLNNLEDRVRKVYNDDELINKIKNTSDRLELKKILPADFFVKIFFTNKENQTLLHVAAQNCFPRAIEPLIIDYNIDVNLQDNSNRTALHAAFDKPNRSVIKILLIYEADINIQNNAGQTPIEYAVEIINIVESLPEHNDHVEDEWTDDEDGETLCCMHAYKEMLNFLRDHVLCLKADNSKVLESNLKALSLD